MKISSIVAYLESFAPFSLQEAYDNTGLLTGSPEWECTGVLCTLDATEAVVEEAIKRNCNLIVTHHPIIFRGLKKINGKNYVERTVIQAIKNDIAILAIHTNLDNILGGVNGKVADKLQLINKSILSSKSSTLNKLFTFVPLAHLDKVRNAIFESGAGQIGNYSECSFHVPGTGTFKGDENTNPFVGQPGKRHEEDELKLEVVFPSYLRSGIVKALKDAHPYEEVAYDIIELANSHALIGAGLVGELPASMNEKEFLKLLKTRFGLQMVRHSLLLDREIKKIAICGGAGSFLISSALATHVDAFVTADMKYHEFFDADSKMLICDIGHYESEQFTTDLLTDLLQEKFPTFAVLKSDVKTNPVHYYF